VPEHGASRDPGFEPHVDDVIVDRQVVTADRMRGIEKAGARADSAMLRLSSACANHTSPLRETSFGRVRRTPVAEERVGMLGKASGCTRPRDGDAPRALARDAPVGARLDHLRDALLSEGGEPRAGWMAATAFSRRPFASIEMNHCGVARKRTGLWQRQQCG
jgi:hypothetical protein